MIELNTLAHALDPSRQTAIRRCDFCKDVVDVYSPSIWSGWYQGKYTEYKARVQAEIKKVDHFLHMEWGGDSHARRHSEIAQVLARAPQEGDWSETYICDLFDCI
jgi:beta-galactosidase